MRVVDRIGRRMKLQDLNVLVTTAQVGSMGEAARRLNTSQSAVSRSIADLEHALGVRLLERDRQGIEPTRYGRALLQCGVAVFDELRQGVKNIEFLADPTAGEVRIGSNPLLASSFVSAVINRVACRYPRIVFHLITARYDALHTDLNERNVDLLVARRYGPIMDERLDFEPLFEDSYVVAAGAQNALVRRRKLALADLMNEPWVLPHEGMTRSAATEAFRASGLDDPKTTVFTNSPETRISLLTTGRFLTVFSASSLRFPLKRSDIKLLPIYLPTAKATNGIVTLKSRTLSPVAQLFIDETRELAKSMIKRSA
jgi:DNA-binding transcriptional LysR family regulator